MTKKVVIASLNPVKISTTAQGFQQMFPQETFDFLGVDVPSGVAAQPMSRAETIQGAENRAANALATCPDADYAVGIEGGIERVNGRLEVFAWVIVRSGEHIGRAQTGIFYLPNEVANLIQQGLELGHADDMVFGRENSKQANGSIGLLTDDVLTRESFYTPAVIMALIPFKKPQFTWR